MIKNEEVEVTVHIGGHNINEEEVELCEKAIDEANASFRDYIA